MTDIDADDDLDDDVEDEDEGTRLRVIVNLADREGTSITISNRSLEEVLDEYHRALAEQRLMDVGMNRREFTHRVSPYQVSYIQTLEY